MQYHKIVPNTTENIEKCKCPECPIYNRCMKENNEHLFCSIGITECNFNKTGCDCPNCQIWAKYQLISLFYCEKGAEKH